MSTFRTIRRILVPGLAAVLLFATSASAQSIPTLPTPERLIDGDAPTLEPPDDSIAVHATVDGRTVVLSIENRTLKTLLSEDGVTFAPGPDVTGTVADRPVFAAISKSDDAGTVHVLLLEGRDGGFGLGYVRGDDVGRNWTDVRTLTSPSDGAGGTFRSASFAGMRLAVGPDGRVAVGWTGTPRGFWVVVSGDNGASWSTPQRLDPPVDNGDFFGLDLGFTANGRLVYVYSLRAQPDPQTVSPLVVRTSDDLGATFSAPTLIEPNAQEAPYVVLPHVQTTADGGILVFGAGTQVVRGDSVAVVYRSIDGGRTFFRTFLEARWGYGFFDRVHGFTARDGRVLFVFEDGLRGFRVATSVDHGATFPWVTTLVGVRSDFLFGGSFSAVALEGGRWILGGETGQLQGPTRYFALRSEDAGASWTSVASIGSDQFLSRTRRDDLDGGLAQVADGSVIAVFRDRDQADPMDSDVFAARFDPSSLAWGDPVRIDPPETPLRVLTGRLRSAASRGRVWVARGAEELLVQTSEDGGRTYGDPVRVSTQVNLSNDGGFEIATDPTGSAHVAWSDIDRNSFRISIMYAVSRDGGATWTGPIRVVPDIGPTGVRGPIRLLGRSDGAAWIVWSDGRIPRVHLVEQDGGLVTDLTPPRPPFPSFVDLDACAAAGRLYLRERVSRSDDSYFVHVLEPGEDGFRERIQVDDSTTRSNGIAMTCSPDGTATFAWMEPTESFNEGDLRVRTFDGSDGGPTVALDSDVGRSAIALSHGSGAASDVVVTYGKYVFRGPGEVGFAHWATRIAGDVPPVRIDLTSDTPDDLDSQVRVVAGDDDRVWVAWTEGPLANAEDRTVTVRSDDGGRSWGPLRRIGTATPERVHSELDAQVLAVPGGAAFAFLGSRSSDLYQTWTNVDRVNADPIADAGSDQRLECEGNLAATAILDGSGSTDPDGDDDLESWTWSVAGDVVAQGAVVSASFPVGSTEVALTVADRAGATGTDAATIVVVDSVAPTGGIALPGDGTCHAGDVTVETDFADVCDPELDIAFDPSGPTFVEHGDHAVTATATDEAGNASSDAVAFTIDRNAPQVAVLVDDLRSLLPSGRPLASVFASNDDDGATGGVVHETLELAGCRIYDGATFGDADGLLSDETVVLDLAEVCRLAERCGWTSLESPEFAAEAVDCAGNVGRSARVLPGSLAPLPGICGD